MLKAQPDYREELERAAKQMILIHRVDTLVKLVLKTIVRIMCVEHASLLIFDEARGAYVAHTSQGVAGSAIPKGFARISTNNPVIRYFVDRKLRIVDTDYLLLSQINNPKDSFQEQLKDQFLLHNAKACIPGFFRDTLVFALLLGGKTDGSDFTYEELGFLSVLSSDVVMAIQNARLFQDLDDQLLKNKKLFLQTVFALSQAIEAKDHYTQGHTERVTHYALILAEELKLKGGISGMNTKKFLENLRISSLLHDIGKIGVPEAILNKNGQLEEWERKEINKHPIIGANILNKIDEFYEPIVGVKYHHERYDGTGYPEGLKEDMIPLVARIIAVADTFDAMTTDRPYRKGLSKDEAIRVIEKESSKQFDPAVVSVLLDACKKGAI
jgi:HD-GYP domain-containing protein (c-di-GMP phosphodiesterase class II)